MRKFYIVSYIIMTALAAAALLIAVLASVGIIVADTSFTAGLTLVSLAVFAAVQLVCASLYRGAGRSAVYLTGFAAMHVGLLAFLGGGLIYAVSGDGIYADLPVGGGTYSHIMREDVVTGELYRDALGFGVAADTFTVETYADTGMDKAYTAELTLTDDVTLRTTKASLGVNHPVRFAGAKIYLMSYSSDGEGDTLRLFIKRDGGEWLSTAGCVAVMLGAFMLCLGRKNKREKTGETLKTGGTQS